MKRDSERMNIQSSSMGLPEHVLHKKSWGAVVRDVDAIGDEGSSDPADDGAGESSSFQNSLILPSIHLP